ncbi:MAG: hypothetical protein V4575_06095 [Pseudomonadota bacterium]
MSKISPIQAQALGLKTAAPKPAATKPAVKTASKTAAPSQPAASKAVAKPAPTRPVEAKPAGSVLKSAKKVVKKDNKADDKKPKQDKVKMERDSFTMPKEEYAQIALLKARLTSMGQPAKKSELLRAGIKLLAAMSDNTLKTTLAKIPVIKTGRPNKKD